MSARITAYMVSRMVSEISSSLHFMRSTPEPDSELRPISSLKIRRLAFDIEQPGKEKRNDKDEYHKASPIDSFIYIFFFKIESFKAK